jgi:hypothetical protein
VRWQAVASQCQHGEREKRTKNQVQCFLQSHTYSISQSLTCACHETHRRVR